MAYIRRKYVKYLLFAVGVVMAVLFLINLFPPYPSYPLGCVEMGGQYISIYQNFYLLLVAIVLLFVAAILSGEEEISVESAKNSETETLAKSSGLKAYELLKNLLDKDEMVIMQIVLENDGVTQDSLHFRTEFSHSKISMVVKKLEEKNLIVRERFGRTYRIHMSEWLKDMLGENETS